MSGAHHHGVGGGGAGRSASSSSFGKRKTQKAQPVKPSKVTTGVRPTVGRREQPPPPPPSRRRRPREEGEQGEAGAGRGAESLSAEEGDGAAVDLDRELAMLTDGLRLATSSSWTGPDGARSPAQGAGDGEPDDEAVLADLDALAALGLDEGEGAAPGAGRVEKVSFFEAEEQDIDKDIEELSRMVSRAAAAAKAAANLRSLSFLDGTDISSLDEKAYEKLLSTNRLRRKKPLPEMEPTLPPAPSREGKSRIVSAAWLRESQSISMAGSRRREAGASPSRTRWGRRRRAAGGGGGGDYGSAPSRSAITQPGSAGDLFGDFGGPRAAGGASKGDRTAAFEEIESVVKEIKEWKGLQRIFAGMSEELGRRPTRAEWAFRAGFRSESELDARLRKYRRCDERFVERMSPIVNDVSRRYGYGRYAGRFQQRQRPGESVDHSDIFMAGMMGAWKCVDKWDPEGGQKFNFIVPYYIRSAMAKCQADRLRDDTPASIFMMIGKVRRTSKMLQERLGRTPTDEEVGSVLKISARRVGKVKSAMTKRVSAERASEHSMEDGDMRTAADTLSDPDAGYLLDDCVDEMMDDDVDSLLKTLAPREYMVLSRRYPMKEDDTSTLEEIGSSMQVCRERVRQIEDKAIKKLQGQAMRDSSGNPLFLHRLYDGHGI